MAPRNRGPPPSPDGPGTRLWSKCARSADSGSPRNPWASWGGEHRSTRIRAIRTRGAQTRGPREIADFVGWETWGPHEACFVGWETRGPQEACFVGWETRGPREIADFVGWIRVRDPATLLQPPPKPA